jgi:hypothetical protein
MIKICTEIEDIQELYRIMEEDNKENLLPVDCQYQEASFSPCYLYPLVDTQNLTKDISVDQYLELLAQSKSPESSILYSVTTREYNHKEWLDAALGVPGAMIYETPRVSGGKPYTCYLCIVPVTPRI